VAELDPAIDDPQHAPGRLPWMPGTRPGNMIGL